MTAYRFPLKVRRALRSMIATPREITPRRP
jgi:hypothetical protein